MGLALTLVGCRVQVCSVARHPAHFIANRAGESLPARGRAMVPACFAPAFSWTGLAPYVCRRLHAYIMSPNTHTHTAFVTGTIGALEVMLPPGFPFGICLVRRGFAQLGAENSRMKHEWLTDQTQLVSSATETERSADKVRRGFAWLVGCLRCVVPAMVGWWGWLPWSDTSFDSG